MRDESKERIRCITRDLVTLRDHMEEGGMGIADVWQWIDAMPTAA